MRPRPESRGDRGEAAHRRTAGRASRRPPPDSRGDRWPPHVASTQSHCFNAATARKAWRSTETTRRFALVTALQCGHGPKAVEIVSDVGAPLPERLLQCGHGPKAVEIIQRSISA